MDEVSRFGEDQTMAEPVEITKSCQIIEMGTRPRLRAREKNVRGKTRFAGGSKTGATFCNLI